MITGLDTWDLGVAWETRLVTPATELAAPVDYIRDQVLRAVNGGIEDEHIRRLILAATGVYEGWTFRALMPQTYAMVMDRFPARQIRVSRPPLISVTSVTYADAAGTEQTLDPTAYRVKASGVFNKAEVWPTPGGAWPAVQGGWPDAVIVTYQAGVPDLAAAPHLERAIAGIAILVSELYTHRLFMLPGSFSVSELVKGGVTPSGLRFDYFWSRAW